MATDTAAVPQAPEAATVMQLLPSPPCLLTPRAPTRPGRRNELLRRLVEREIRQARPRTLALESDCVGGTIVDDYVTWGTGTLDEAVEHGFGHGSGDSGGDRDLVRWMRAHNEHRPAAERLRFAGIGDPLEGTGTASPRWALTALHAHLAARVGPDLLPCTAARLDRLLGSEERWTGLAAPTGGARSYGRSADAMELRLLADDLEALLDARTPHPPGTRARDDLDRARLYARTATGLLRYHFWAADTSRDRPARLAALRDRMTAAHLLALAGRGPALVYAHDRPVPLGESTVRLSDLPLRWWGATALGRPRGARPVGLA
ncbi:erythromycin esterase family protein [Streptomyces flavofungini]|uniref:erythromycin esterase family protein n=1 Tax=Streptomyces flavofungini TaxID=68200 RepID=UPI0034DE2F74